MTVGSLIPALALALATAGGMRPPRRGGDHMVVVVRTADQVHVGRSLSFHDGVFRLQGSKHTVEVSEESLVRAVFLRRLDGLKLDAVVGLAIRVVVPKLPVRRKGPGATDLASVLRHYGGVFILPTDKASVVFPRFARQVTDARLAAVLGAELIDACRTPADQQAAADLLARAQSEAADPEVGFAYGLLRAALFLRTRRALPAKEALDDLRTRYPTQKHRLDQLERALRFRDAGRGPRGSRRDGPRSGFPRP